MKCLAPALLGIAVVASTALTAWGDDNPGRLRRYSKGGDHKVAVGDVIEVVVNSLSDTGPINSINNFRIVVKGDGVLTKAPVVVLVPPPEPRPGEPRLIGASAELRSYLTVEGKGEAKVTITPLKGTDSAPQDPITLNIKAVDRSDLPEDKR